MAPAVVRLSCKCHCYLSRFCFLSVLCYLLLGTPGALNSKHFCTKVAVLVLLTSTASILGSFTQLLVCLWSLSNCFCLSVITIQACSRSIQSSNWAWAVGGEVEVVHWYRCCGICKKAVSIMLTFRCSDHGGFCPDFSFFFSAVNWVCSSYWTVRKLHVSWKLCGSGSCGVIAAALSVVCQQHIEHTCGRSFTH